jgi:hypothetical protein
MLAFVCVAVDTAVPGSHALLDLGVTSPSPPPVKREPPEHKALLHGIIGQHPHMAHRPSAYTTSTTGNALCLFTELASLASSSSISSSSSSSIDIRSNSPFVRCSSFRFLRIYGRIRANRTKFVVRHSIIRHEPRITLYEHSLQVNVEYIPHC